MKTVCVQCRIRKVRCKGEKPACSNCRRLKFSCSFQQTSREPALVDRALEPPRKCRGSRACLACRARKTRCLGETPVCSNCRRRGRSCIYENEEVQRDEVGYVADPTSHESLVVDASSGGTPECISRLITLFFERLFPLSSYSFLHRAAVMKRCHEGVLDESLKLTICAVTILYVGGRSPSSDAWADAGQKLILQNLSQPSVLHLQALLLLIRYRAGAGKFSSAFLLAGFAARSAVGLRLNYERSDLGPVAQEVRRRTFWSLYLLDDVFSVGLKDFELCRPDIIHLQLPSEDIDFERERYIPTGALESNTSEGAENIGFRGLFLRVTFIRRAIMRLNRELSSESFDPSTLSTSIDQFERQLQNVEMQLRFFDMSTLINIADDRWNPQSVMLRLSLHQCYCDLYRIFLTGYPEAAPQSAVERISLQDRGIMRYKCLDHAQVISQIIVDFADNREQTQILDYDAAVCMYHSLRLILFDVSTQSSYYRAQKQTLIERAKASVEIMIQLFHFLAPVKPMIADLEKLLQYTTTSTLPACSLPAVTHSTTEAVKVAREASVRQRLSIHSLLLQADFVDDSSQAAESVADNCSTTTLHYFFGTNGARSAPDGTAFSEAHTEPTNLIFNVWMGFPSVEDPSALLGSVVEDF